MSNKTRILPREINQAVKWALRGAKLPASYAQPVGEMTQYAEIYYQNGLTTFHEYLTNLTEAPPKSAVFIKENERSAHLDAQGEHLLICSADIFDLAYAQAKHQGQYIVWVDNVGGGFNLLEQRLYQRVKRGLVGQLKHQVTSNDIQYLMAFPVENDAFLFSSHQAEWSLRVRAQLQSSAPPDLDLSLTNNSFILWFRANTNETELNINLEPFVTLADSIESVTVHRPASRLAQLEQAHREGLLVDAQIWSEIKKFGERILVPVSKPEAKTGTWSKRDPS